MAYFRDDEYDKTQVFIPQTPLEHLESARWYHWINCPISAMRELDAVAASIEEDCDPLSDDDFLSYEETRFEEETENDRQNWE